MTLAAAYVDASAFVKLIAQEPESESLSRFLRQWPRRISSVLLRTEVLRAARTLGAAGVTRARAALERVELVSVSEEIFEQASFIDPLTVRTLDAIHLATARLLIPDVEVLVAYDRRMIDAAGHLGLHAQSPS